VARRQERVGRPSSTATTAEAVRVALEAAGRKNLEVFSPTIGRQLLQLGLIDEIDLHIAPILLGTESGCTTAPAMIRFARIESATARPRRP
jgi:dihydrofolate reductase